MCQLCAVGGFDYCLDQQAPEMEAPVGHEPLGVTVQDPLISIGEIGDWVDDDYESEEHPAGSLNNPRRSSGRRGSQGGGRKVATKLFPLDRSKPCEWQGLANCGGGDFPIVGCPAGIESTQVARHHGPEKNVQNNSEGNVHRICAVCHNRWHAKNDPNYDWNAGFWSPHNPRPQTPEEARDQMLSWMKTQATKKRRMERQNGLNS